jgi:hypothetical protein
MVFKAANTPWPTGPVLGIDNPLLPVWAQALYHLLECCSINAG